MQSKVFFRGRDVEIIIVNDGSKDNTSRIGHEYAEKYPDIIKVIDKENGGHGDAVNSGLAAASGKYFKVVDSDDWVKEESLHRILQVLRGFEEEGQQVDMLIANYVYEKEGMENKKCIHYRNVLPQDEIFHWSDIGHFHLDQYILMHSVIYRTELLQLCQLRLPKHTFYVDNIYVYYPLPHVRKMYYMDEDFLPLLYRPGRSIRQRKGYDKTGRPADLCDKKMIDMYQMKEITNKAEKIYMINYLAIMMTVSSILCIRSKERENLDKEGPLAIFEEEGCKNLL